MFCKQLDCICGDFTNLLHITKHYKKLLVWIFVLNLEIKTLPEVSRPGTQWPGLVSRPRPRPWSPILETKTI